MKKILLVEDDSNLAFMLTDGLEGEEFEVLHFVEGEKAIKVLSDFDPDIVLLDVNIQGMMDGFDVARRIRESSQVPVIFTTSRSLIEDIQKGFQIGNVDYLKKPYGIRELVLRIHELINRYPKQHHGHKSYQIGQFFFVPSEQNLKVTEEKIRLQKNESVVLSLLCENEGLVVTKNDIIECLWDDDEDQRQKEQSMYNIISSLRNKLCVDNKIKIEAVPKVGWKLIVIDD